MSVANPKASLSVRDQVSKDEWEARVNLAAAYRLVALYGWDDSSLPTSLPRAGIGAPLPDQSVRLDV